MTANEVMILARSGELRQLGPNIRDDDATLITFINLGLVEIYKRFILKTGEAIITLVDGKTIYSLDGTDPDVDMGGQEFMYLIAAYGESLDDADYTDDDIILPINVEDDAYSINTISYNQVQVPLITVGARISLIYGAKPTKVTALTLDAELDIPDQYVEPLLHYIGYRGHGAMDGNIQAESNTHYMRFERSCDKVRELGVGIAPDDFEMPRRIEDRGFI